MNLSKTAPIAIVIAVASTLTTIAQERQLSGSEVKELLPTIKAIGSGSSQTFDTNGNTTYVTGRPSLGQWEVRGDKYCSVWPPNNVWTCFGVVLDEEKSEITWVSENGDREVNRYVAR